MKKIIAFLSVVACFGPAFAAEWSTIVENNKTKIANTAGWHIQYESYLDGIALNSYGTVAGSTTEIDFTTVYADTGLMLYKLSDNVFKDKSSLTRIVYPDTLKEVAYRAFYNCSGLAGELVLDMGPVIIGDGAYSSTAFETIVVPCPGSVIGNSVFNGSRVRQADIRGAATIGNSLGGPNTWSDCTLTNIIISSCMTNIGNNAFNKQRKAILTTVNEAIDLDEVYAGDGHIGSGAFYDFGSYSDNHNQEIVIPFRGSCSIDNQAFNWARYVTNFVFWGKAPAYSAISSTAFSSCPNYGRISGNRGVDEAGWLALAAENPLTDEDRGNAKFPGDNCFGKLVNGSVTLWLCWGDSPYDPTVPTAYPQLSGYEVVRSGEGFSATGMLNGAGNVYVRFGDKEFNLTDGEVHGPVGFSGNMAVSKSGGLDPDTSYLPVFHAVNSVGRKMTRPASHGVYTGEISISKLSDASEDQLKSGYFRISRANTIAATAYDLAINVSFSGSAAAGRNYYEVESPVVIPAGMNYVDVKIAPVMDAETVVDTEVTATITGGDYYIGSASSATMTVANVIPDLDDVYVDANAAEGGDGSVAAPFRTLQDGAAAAKSGHVVWVRGGVDRVYSIATYADMVAIDKDNISIKGYNEGVPSDYRDTGNMARIEIEDTFATDVFDITGASWTDNAPFIISNATCHISGLKFEFSGKAFSLQNKHIGPLFLCFEDGFKAERCVFEQSTSPANWGVAVRGFAWAKKTSAQPVYEGCAFIGDPGISGITGVVSDPTMDTRIIGCYFENVCSAAVNASSKASGLFFVSNVVVNCRGGADASAGFFKPIGNGTMMNAKIEYNVFAVTDYRTPYSLFVHGCQYGGSFRENVSFCHNTVVGYDWMIFSNRYRYTGGSDLAADVWAPVISNNLFIAKDGGICVLEKTTLNDNVTHLGWPDKLNNVVYTNSCSFRVGSVWHNNAVKGVEFATTDDELPEYSLEPLDRAGSVALTEAPVWRNTTDPFSPDYYRFNAADYPELVLADGEDYIGAVKPFGSVLPPVQNSGLIIFIR